MPPKMPFSGADFAVLVIAVVCVAASAIFIYGGKNGTAFVKVSAGNGETLSQWEYPLSAVLTFAVRGELGDTIVEIKDGGARIKDSPCKNKTCVAAGVLHKAGTFSACLPNRVMLSIENSADVEAQDKAREEADAGVW